MDQGVLPPHPVSHLDRLQLPVEFGALNIIVSAAQRQRRRAAN
jgi:hypothetical protein